jgi:hypothetical protein
MGYRALSPLYINVIEVFRQLLNFLTLSVLIMKEFTGIKGTVVHSLSLRVSYVLCTMYTCLYTAQMYTCTVGTVQLAYVASYYT